MEITDGMSEDEKYMSRCIQLAKNGLGSVSPNPLVGAVIVCDGKIIGEGYHVCCGCEHAEVNAVYSVDDAALLHRSTLYVTLEPCSHYGKTPPCADMIVSKQIPRVVIGCEDPSSKVSGRGIKKLRDAGVEVRVGVLETECKWLIRRFTVFNGLKRPYVILKWAESADGFMDYKREGGKPVVLSNPLTTMLVHKKRTEADAIMVGTRTALLDNPSLTVRNWYGKNPVRIVLDRNLSLPAELILFDGAVKTLVFTEKERLSRNNVEYLKVNFEGDLLVDIMHALFQRDVQSLLVEGGSMLLQSFIDKGLWDEIYIEKSPLELHDGIKAPVQTEWGGYFPDSIWNAHIYHIVRK